MAASVLEDALLPLPRVPATRASDGTAGGEEAATLASDVDGGADPLLAGGMSQVCDVILTSLAFRVREQGGGEGGRRADLRGIPFHYFSIFFLEICIVSVWVLYFFRHFSVRHLFLVFFYYYYYLFLSVILFIFYFLFFQLFGFVSYPSSPAKKGRKKDKNKTKM